jgi:hypothetical protein
VELLLILLGLAVTGTIAGMRTRRRTRRQRRLVLVCRDAGVRTSVLDPFTDTVYLPFRLFGRADRHGVENVVWDPRDDGAVRVFDYWFEERSDQGIGVKKDVTCGIVPLPFGVPPLSVLPRGMPDVSQEPVAPHGVRLELDAFNRRFDVRAADPKAAVAFLDQPMMQTLLLIPVHMAIHVHEDRMLVVGPTLEPAMMLVLLGSAHSLAERIPPVVASLYPPRPAEGPFEDRWLQGAWSPEPTSADLPNRADLGG